jgi:hypothetical protein
MGDSDRVQTELTFGANPKGCLVTLRTCNPSSENLIFRRFSVNFQLAFTSHPALKTSMSVNRKTRNKPWSGKMNPSLVLCPANHVLGPPNLSSTWGSSTLISPAGISPRSPPQPERVQRVLCQPCIASVYFGMDSEYCILK